MEGLTRRQFLIASASFAAIGLLAHTRFGAPKPPVTGGIRGASAALGHRLRSPSFPPASQEIRTRVLIVGGGIAGLSAAWHLQRSGTDDFLLLDLEAEVGGNAAGGENEVSAYPWGAHYVPLLTEDSTEARALFEDLGIITGYEGGLPVYDEYALSADPHERLFIHGRWQEGLVPQLPAGSPERAQYDAFFAEMEGFRNARGDDGKRLFAIPLDRSSTDPETRALDRISFADYLDRQGWDSPYLRWYLDYCCRDDYGAEAKDVSAWAGIHYFAGRDGRAANADAQTVLTWPMGNGEIVRRLKERMGGKLRTGMLAHRIEERDAGVIVDCFDTVAERGLRFQADAVIIATPRFVAERIRPTGRELSEFHYSPWMVANVTLSRLPAEKGAPLAWDNMVYASPLLGYVNASSQSLSRNPRQTVLTYYWPQSHLPPGEARREMLAKPYEGWRDMVLKELLRIHPDLDGAIESIDVWLWGHGMIRPSPGFVWGEARRELQGEGPVFYAHSDMSGVSIFEEANYRGVEAARLALAHFEHARAA